MKHSCKCGEIFNSASEILIHLNILRPTVPSHLSVEKGWVTQEKYDLAVRNLEEFNKIHSVTTYDILDR